MKKGITILFFGLAFAAGAQAQEYNLFHDVDAEGWLWFDTDEKIDKYVGECLTTQTGFAIDPNGKPIQLVPAMQYPDYPETTADAYYTGAGAEGVVGGEGAKTGAIMLEPATGLSAYSGMNGGGIVVLMPSCSTFSLSLSCEGSGYVHMSASTNVNAKFDKEESEGGFTVISAKHAAWSPLFTPGLGVWEGIEDLNNGYEPYFTLKSNSPIYAYFRSASTSTMYIHGIRVTTPTNSTLSVSDVAAKQQNRIFFEGNRVVLNEPADIKVYSADGLLMNAATHADRMDLSNMPKGIYIVKAGDATRKLAVQ